MFPVACALAWAVAASNNPSAPPTTNWNERYEYRTVRADDASTSVERVTMQYLTTNGTLYMHYRSEHQKGSEEISIRCDLNGSNVVATKQEYAKSGKQLSDARIWVEAGKVHVEQLLDENRKKVRSRDAEGKPVAADASLMAMFRFFPFDQGRTQDVLIATFTQHFVTMQVKQLGSEAIAVPAGTIDCYKLEGIVDLFVTSIRTVYWIRKAEPHVLMQYEGKRGLFLAPTYVTSMVATNATDATNAVLPPAAPATNRITAASARPRAR